MRKWIGLILISIGTQVVAADGNEPRVVYVKESKSLWSVASAVKPTEVRMWQAVMALYERNPDAFHDNDVNKLKDNVALVVPSTEVMLSLTEVEALARFQLLGDQPDLDKVTLDTSSKSSVAPKVELTVDESVAALNLSMPDNTQEHTENQKVEDKVLLVDSCLPTKCHSPQKKSTLTEHKFIDVGDLYVSVGGGVLNDYKAHRTDSAGAGSASFGLNGGTVLGANLGYLWRDSIVLELGLDQANSDFYSASANGQSWIFGQDQIGTSAHKMEIISAKILFSTDFGKQVSLYSGIGIGKYKSTSRSSNKVSNTTLTDIYFGNLYQILLGSKLNLTESYFLDLRVHDNRFDSGTLASSYSPTGEWRFDNISTIKTTLSVGRKL